MHTGRAPVTTANKRQGKIDSSQLQARFLAAFSACCSITQAARWAKLTKQAHYCWIKDDPTYLPRFKAAQERAGWALHDEAVRRAAEGVKKAVWYKGKVVGTETEYSDMLLAQTLKANFPERYRDRSSVELGAVGGGPLDIQLTFVPSPKPGEVVRQPEVARIEGDNNGAE